MGLIDKTPFESEALSHASDMAGEYIESLHSTDMARWTREQWMGLIEVIVAGFGEKMSDLAKTEAPF